MVQKLSKLSNDSNKLIEHATLLPGIRHLDPAVYEYDPDQPACHDRDRSRLLSSRDHVGRRHLQRGEGYADQGAID